MTAGTVYAAGGVVWRLRDGRVQVLLVHRTKYRDVSLPKGKLEPGELLVAAAVREIREETGIATRLGPPLGMTQYALASGKEKVVHYWAMEATEDAVRSSVFRPNNEIAGLEWVPLSRAHRRLTYMQDGEILDAFTRLTDTAGPATFPVVALRHGKAMARSDWAGPDAGRPLLPRGRKQARGVVKMLRAFGVRRIVSSTARRCVQTVEPLAAAIDRRIRETDAISQDAWEDGTSDVRSVVGKRVRSGKPAVLCSHGPVLPAILDELALATGTMRGGRISDAAALETGAFSVVHVSSTNPGAGIVEIETHAPGI